MRPSEPRNFCDMSVCGRRVGWRMVYVQCVEIVPREQRCRLCGIQWCSARVERTNFRFLDLCWHRHELRGHTHHTFSKPHGTRFLSISHDRSIVSPSSLYALGSPQSLSAHITHQSDHILKCQTRKAERPSLRSRVRSDGGRSSSGSKTPLAQSPIFTRPFSWRVTQRMQPLSAQTCPSSL